MKIPRWVDVPNVPWSGRIYADILEAAKRTRAARQAGIFTFEAKKRAELAAARREAATRAMELDQEASSLTKKWREELRQRQIAEVRDKLEAEEGKRNAEVQGRTVPEGEGVRRTLRRQPQRRGSGQGGRILGGDGAEAGG